MSTPMLQQWEACKQKAQEALLLFRLGDFYEAFFEDATEISALLGLTLTQRQNVPMCGIPFHTLDLYADKLLSFGKKVAIAEQMENPADTKGLVRREIVRILSPATLLHSSLLSPKQYNFFASLTKKDGIFHAAFLDISTSHLEHTSTASLTELLDTFFRLRPTECLVEESFSSQYPLFFRELSYAFPILVTEKPSKGLSPLAFLLQYLRDDLSISLDISPQPSQEEPFLLLDKMTLKNLELTHSIADGTEKNTLLSFLDKTKTPMGGRLLREWIQKPLLSISAIEQRQRHILSLATSDLASFLPHLSSIKDLSRLLHKLSSKTGSPKDLLSLAQSLVALQHLFEKVSPIFPLAIEDFSPLTNVLLQALCESPPLRIGDSETIQDTYSPKIQQLRSLLQNGTSWLAQYQATLREETGIKSLKVGYTKAFGYYIEVPRAQGEKVPQSFQRRQTLVNAERFLTDSLRDFEHQILSAESQILALEKEIFQELLATTLAKKDSILQAAHLVALFDVYQALSTFAKKKNWTLPTFTSQDTLQIEQGRHPVIEAILGEEKFIANDIHLSPKRQMMLLTGPNMAGKSTYLRQTALLVLLAQMGSFVPAKAMHLSPIDKIFSRLGASDDLARGQSTFMVEMEETSHILENATSSSLLLLDEIGRGTSTYDGISLAWAVAQYLLTEPKKQAKTLFATHYWELTELAKDYPHVQNFHTTVQETPNDIVFLRKVVQGGIDKSYGIHVARLAKLPPKVLSIAENMRQRLETERGGKKKSPKKPLILEEQFLLF